MKNNTPKVDWDLFLVVRIEHWNHRARRAKVIPVLAFKKNWEKENNTPKVDWDLFLVVRIERLESLHPTLGGCDNSTSYACFQKELGKRKQYTEGGLGFVFGGKDRALESPSPKGEGNSKFFP